MNTTKDECDGWIDTAVCKFPEHSKTVLIHDQDGGIWTAYWYDKQWCLSNGILISRQSVTHWRELPEPPKPKDAFEAWWNTLTPDSDLGHEFCYVRHDRGMVFKSYAKVIWEAAINSTKQC